MSAVSVPKELSRCEKGIRSVSARILSIFCWLAGYMGVFMTFVLDIGRTGKPAVA